MAYRRDRTLDSVDLAIVKGIAQCLPRKAIAKKLGRSDRTVDARVPIIMRKLGLRGTANAMLTRWAIKNGLV